MTTANEFAEVLELLEQVPHPPEAERWTGATSGQLAGLERRLGFTLPDVYRAWLSTCNGVVAGPGGLYGVETAQRFIDVEGVLQIHPEWIEERWIPIAGDGNGNHYVLDLSLRHLSCDAVFFVDSVEDPTALAYVVASGLPRFLIMLLRKELGDRRWPFDRFFVLEKDPDIASVDPVSLLPWES